MHLSAIATLNTATGALGTLNLSFSLFTALYKLGNNTALYKLFKQSQYIGNLPEWYQRIKSISIKTKITGKCIQNSSCNWDFFEATRPEHNASHVQVLKLTIQRN